MEQSRKGIVMTYEVFKKLYNEAKLVDSYDKYMMTIGWQDWMQDYRSSDYNADKLLDICDFIYKCANGGVRELCNAAKIKMTKLSLIVNIPYTTLQRWAYGQTDYPEHIKQLVTFAIFTCIFD